MSVVDEVHKAVKFVEIEFEKISGTANLSVKGLEEAITNLKNEVAALEKKVATEVDSVEDSVTPSTPDPSPKTEPVTAKGEAKAS